MAADGKRRKVIRKRKAKAAGQDRKRKLARDGSTPTAAATFGDKKIIFFESKSSMNPSPTYARGFCMVCPSFRLLRAKTTPESPVQPC